MSCLLFNCRVVSPGVDLNDGFVLIEKGIITQVGSMATPLPSAAKMVDLAGLMLLPGFIDVHCHGKAGHDFCDGTIEAIEAISCSKLAEGVTTLLPTTLTLSEARLAKALHSAAECVKSHRNGCKLPGVHLEGPYINPKNLGAQNPEYVRSADIEEVKRLNSIFPVLKISYAVEMQNAESFTRDLISMNIQPSCVHSNATYAQFSTGHNAGLRHLSHFCNQMSPLHHRDIGLVGAGLLNDDVFVEIICDQLHLCPDMIKLIFKLKPHNLIELVSDAMRAAGMPDGEYTLGGLPVFVQNGAARLGDGALAGSTLEINRALQNICEVTQLPIADLVQTTSLNQARSFGWDNLGKIAPNYRADIVVLEQNFDVHSTYIDGVMRYQK